LHSGPMRLPVTQEIAGSNPVGTVNFHHSIRGFSTKTPYRIRLFQGS
jgi:hypothetical protein